MRKRLKKILTNSAIIATLLFSGAMTLFPLFKENWPTYMGNQYLTGNNDGIIPEGEGVLWKFNSPAPEGRVYNPVGVEDRVYVVSTDNHLYCLDMKDGSVIWKFKSEGALTRMVVVYEGRVYLPAMRFLYCLDAEKGDVIWARRDPSIGFYGTPAIAQGKIFYGNRRGFYTRELRNGHLIWENQSIYTYGGFPSYWNGMVYTVSKEFQQESARLIALDEKDGSIRWQVVLENVSNIYSPVVYQERIYLAFGNRVAVYGATSGEKLRETMFLSPVASNPVFSQGSVYLSLADGTIVKIDPETGNWAPLYKVPYATQFAAVGSYLFIPVKDVSGGFAMINAETGEEERRIGIGEGEPTSITISKGIAFVSTLNSLVAVGKGDFVGLVSKKEKPEPEKIQKVEPEKFELKAELKKEISPRPGVKSIPGWAEEEGAFPGGAPAPETAMKGVVPVPGTPQKGATAEPEKAIKGGAHIAPLTREVQTQEEIKEEVTIAPKPEGASTPRAPAPMMEKAGKEARPATGESSSGTKTGSVQEVSPQGVEELIAAAPATAPRKESSGSMPSQPGGQAGLEVAQEPSPELKGETEVIRGSVRDSQSGRPLSGRVEATSRLPGGALSRTSSEFSRGYFEIEVPRKAETDIIVSAEGYTFQTITLPNEKAIDDLSLQPLELELTKVEKGKRLATESIYFRVNSANIEPNSIPVLQQLYQLMMENPKVKIEIEGHTDSTGTSAFNMKLSEQRARAVADWLIRNGISSTRITTKGCGDTRPVADNSTEEGRRKNRRTEILITGGK